MFACPISIDWLVFLLFLEQPRFYNAERQHNFLEIHKFCCLSSRFSLFNFEMNGHDVTVVAEGCAHFPKFDWCCFYYLVRISLIALLEALRALLLVCERKENPEVGTEVGKRVTKNRKETWPYLCRILVNSCSKLPPLLDRYVYWKWFITPKEVNRVSTFGLS